MRHHLLSAVLATICIGAASPVLADDADCGLLCRLSGYLSTDHMAATPNDAGAAPSPKGRRAHVAHKVSTKAAATITDKAKAPVIEAAKPATAKSATAKSAVAKSAVAKSVEAKATSVDAARATPIPAKDPEAEQHLAAVHPRSAKRPSLRAEPQVAAEAAASPVPATQPVHHHTASTRPPVQPAHAQTASAIIPGAAPAMPMGFQPFDVVFH